MNQNRKLALITGASSGIGLELARVFAKNNYDLIIVSNSQKIQTASQLLKQYEVEVTPVEADLSLEEGIDTLWQRIESQGRPLDAAALNAGVGVGGEFYKTNFKEEKKMMNLNMVNLVYLTKKVLQEMIKRNEGKILLTSSIAAEMPGPYYSVYAATKSFIQSFSEALSYEMKDTNKDITVMALQPGSTDTEFFTRASIENTEAGEGKKDDPAEVAQQGFDALMEGKDHIVAGSVKNKVQSFASKFMSEQQGAAAQGKTTKPKDLQ